MLFFLGMTFIALVCLSLVILSIPIDFYFYLQLEDHFTKSATISWLFKLLSIQLFKEEKPAVTPKKVKKIPRKKKPKIKKKKEPKNFGYFWKIFNIVFDNSLFTELKRFLNRVKRSFRIPMFKLNSQFSSGDAAETGMMYGYLLPILSQVPVTKSHYCHVSPDFSDEFIFKGHLEGKIRFFPILLIYSIMRLIFSFTSIKITFRLLILKWKK